MSSPSKRRRDNYSKNFNYRSDRTEGNHNFRHRKTGDHFFHNTANKQSPGPDCKRAEIIRDGRKFPVFQKPSIIGVFSVDADRNVVLDERQLKYLYWNVKESGCTKVNFDLNEGLHSCVRKNELLCEKLDHIFYWMKAEGSKREEYSKSDFVCFRGLLTAIMSTPYEQKDGWIISATQYNNTIYLCAFDTEEKKREKANTTDKQKRFQSWGYKFEQFMLADEPGQEPETSLPVIETEEFACVFRSKLNNHSILYAAEMDGIQSDKPVDSATLKTSVPFVELKTSRHIETQRQDHNFKRYKLLKWWCQSFLVGIESIFCGFRDDDGVVSMVKEYKVRDLPKLAKGLWDPCVCMNFCAQFLDFVKTCIQESTDPNSLWKFEWTPGNSITGQQVAKDSQFSFIPEWFNAEDST